MFSYKLINYQNSKNYNLVNKIKRNSKQVIRKISFEDKYSCNFS